MHACVRACARARASAREPVRLPKRARRSTAPCPPPPSPPQPHRLKVCLHEAAAGHGGRPDAHAAGGVGRGVPQHAVLVAGDVAHLARPLKLDAGAWEGGRACQPAHQGHQGGGERLRACASPHWPKHAGRPHPALPPLTSPGPRSRPSAHSSALWTRARPPAPTLPPVMPRGRRSHRMRWLSVPPVTRP